ncbi:sulfotransferase family 2 domain-containing protein [Roseibium sp. SCPC15]|uniref:sulfotransferase family 2 domain-containing protein n=1 Tax=Roseibium sp. SCP15 TaxID=3141376 RepID=UPI003339601B
MMDEYQLKNFLKFAPARLGIVPKKHLLIHIPKNGGMALREAPELNGKLVLAHRRRLKSKAYANGLLDYMRSRGLHPGYEHARLRDIDTSVRAGTVPFAVIRNPWARTFSRFKFYLQTSGQHERQLELTVEGFEEFLETRHEWGTKDYFWHRASLGWYPQMDYVVDETGKVAVNILRQENLREEVAQYFEVENTLKQKNVSRNAGASYKDFYSKKSIQIVADWYTAEVSFFGFDFETAATRGVYFASES